MAYHSRNDKNMIRITERTTESSAELCDLLHRAHEPLRKQGLDYGTGHISESDMQKKLNADAICYVAYDEDKLVGMEVCSFITINKWFHKGQTAYFELIGVLPEYQGAHIGRALRDQCIKCAKEHGSKTIYSIAAEDNKPIGALYSQLGFKIVGYGAGKTNNFYSVLYMKWFGDCPYSDTYIKFRFLLDRLAHRIIYLPGGNIRFFGGRQE